MKTISKKTVITLSNGLKVANFNSPHEFKFEDGSILPANIDDDQASVDMSPETIEEKNGFKTIVMSPKLTIDATLLLDWWDTKKVLKGVDIVIVPLPVLTALAKTKSQKHLLYSPFRVGVLVDRINKILSINEFCTVESTYVPETEEGSRKGLYNPDHFSSLHKERN